MSTVLGATASVARQAFDALVQGHAPLASHGRAFARFETRFQLAWVIGGVLATAIAVRISISLAVVAVALIPAAGLYARAVREGQRAHRDDPFDPLEVARRRIDHAVEWRRRDLDRLAASELAGVVDLARAAGLEPDLPSVARLEALRAMAVSTWPIDTRELDWALIRVAGLIDELADAGGRSGVADRQHRRGRHRPLRRDARPMVSSRLDESSSDR